MRMRCVSAASLSSLVMVALILLEGVLRRRLVRVGLLDLGGIAKFKLILLISTIQFVFVVDLNLP